ncbi:MAG: LLM class flavin-dependent oxidoreductase, partial [Gaiellales bacterium]
MKISAQFMPGEIDEFTASLKKADEAGLQRAYLVDGQLLWPDIYVYMDRALSSTKNIVVGSGTTNPFTRHLTVTAGAHTTLATLHPGRVVLGIGRGDNAVRTLGESPVRTAE